MTGCMSFMNQPILKYSSEIRSAVLIIHGEKAHSCYFSRDAYADVVRDNPFAENKELMERIIENGCVMSEYPPGMPAVAKNFPNRNRIIAGLSKMVVVVEAGKRSGTIITADLALDYGREVYAVPGNVTSALSYGTNALIKQGCPIITEGSDILSALGIAYKKTEKVKFQIKTAENISPEEKEIFDLIEDSTPISAEALCRRLGRKVQEVQYILSLLELSGYIEKIPQAGYIRAH